MKSGVIFAVVAMVYANAQAVTRGMAGGKSQADVSDPKIQEMAAFAVGELGDQYSLVQINGAESQVSDYTYDIFQFFFFLFF